MQKFEVCAMKCQRCGKELNNSMRCNFCGFDNLEKDSVREMSNAEKNFYNGGVTIDVDSDGKNNKDSHSDYERTSYTQSNFINFGGTNIFFDLLLKFFNGLFSGNILAKIIAMALFIVFLAFMFFVALPIFFAALAVGVIVLIVVPRIKNKFFGRRF